jgi:aspartate-semialdehyde dehydrogenase
MSAGEKISAEWAIKFRNANKDSWVIDNSPQWRMKGHIPLTLPHINWTPNKKHRIIPVPNCVAVMLATALHPLIKLGLQSASVTVMQSVSGTGNPGIEAWEQELKNGGTKKAENSPYLFPALGNIQQATRVAKGEYYNEEEKKVITEMQKMFSNTFEKFPISPSCFRYGAKVGHWAHVRVKMPLLATMNRVKGAFKMGVMVKYTDEPADLLSVVGKNYALVCDLRFDINSEDEKYVVYDFTVFSDNLRLGAAWTALLNAEKIIRKYYQ